jgi:hypothetical protein
VALAGVVVLARARESREKTTLAYRGKRNEGETCFDSNNRTRSCFKIKERIFHFYHVSAYLELGESKWQQQR